MALQAKADERRGMLVPAANAQEAAVVEGIEVIAVGSLAEAVGFFTGQLEIEPTPFSGTERFTSSGGTRSTTRTSKVRRRPSGR